MEFRKDAKGKRYVLAKVDHFHIYHLKCAPEGSDETWVRTEHAACHACHGAIWKEPLPTVKEIKFT